MKTDLEYLNCILSLLDKNLNNHWNEYHKSTIKIDNILQFEEFFQDWTSIYLHEKYLKVYFSKRETLTMLVILIELIFILLSIVIFFM